MKYEDYGIVIQAVGSIIDVRFSESNLPQILTALVIPLKEKKNLLSKLNNILVMIPLDVLLWVLQKVLLEE